MCVCVCVYTLLPTCLGLLTQIRHFGKLGLLITNSWNFIGLHSTSGNHTAYLTGFGQSEPSTHKKYDGPGHLFVDYWPVEDGVYNTTTCKHVTQSVHACRKYQME